jgi:hypothetical protein
MKFLSDLRAHIAKEKRDICFVLNITLQTIIDWHQVLKIFLMIML